MSEISKKFIRKELEPKDFTHKDAVRVIRCWWVIHTDFGGYTENELDFHLWKDGSIAISGARDAQYVSIDDKETLDVLRELLGVAK
jgi:hypothetical protein